MVDDDDIIRGANKLFKSVGSAMKKAGGAVVKAGQQVVGARGTLALSLDRERFAPGDEIHGKVTLAIDEPLEGKKLVVQLRAMQRTVDYHRAGGVRTVGSSKVTIYQFEKELGGPRRYGEEELPFTLIVPRDAAARQAPAPAGKLGDVARAVSSVVAPTTGPIEWRVQATLVVPFGRDLDHGVDIVVD
ncbi:MAG TPA: hypothetical protein VHE35_35235 [Kofleriaceae bacterium]|nr:hypothetical protein [Kofleriaceae bacterium]